MSVPPATTRRLRLAAALAVAFSALASCAPTAQVNEPAPVAQVDLRISVTDTLDAPLSGAIVVVDSREDHVVVGASDANGRFTARVPATLLHSVYSRWDHLAASTLLEVRNEDIAPGVAVDLMLRPAAVVRGVVWQAGRSDHAGILVVSQDQPLTALSESDGRWLLDGWPSGTASSVLFVGAGFAVGLQSFVTGAPGDTTTLPTITLVSDPGGTRARRVAGAAP